MRIPGPGDLVRLTGQTYQAVEQAVGLVPRVIALVGRIEPVVDQIEALVAKADVLITSVQATEQRANALVTDVEAVQLRAHSIVDQTAGVVTQAQTLTERMTPLLDGYQPTLETLAPIVSRIAETTSPDEVNAVVQLIDALPGIVDKLDKDILPVLGTRPAPNGRRCSGNQRACSYCRPRRRLSRHAPPRNLRRAWGVGRGENNKEGCSADGNDHAHRERLREDGRRGRHRPGGLLGGLVRALPDVRADVRGRVRGQSGHRVRQGRHRGPAG